MIYKTLIFCLCIYQSVGAAILCVEGNTGSGKTTLINALCKRNKKYVHVKEPVDKVQNIGGENLLQLYFNDLSRWSFACSCAFHLYHIEELKRAITEHPDSIFVTDRSIFGLMDTFINIDRGAGHLHTAEFHIYKKLFDITLPLVEMPRGFIYLRTNPEIVYQRICKRARKEEQSVPKKYWYQLHEAYEKMFIHERSVAEYVRNIPVLVIDGNDDIQMNPECLDAMVQKVEAFIAHLLQ